MAEGAPLLRGEANSPGRRILGFLSETRKVELRKIVTALIFAVPGQKGTGEVAEWLKALPC